jgi:hypothetical protein
MLEAKQYLGEYLRPRVNDPYKLPEALKRVRTFIATEKSFAQKHIEHQQYLAKLQAEREAAEAARQRVVAAIATRKRIWNEALAAAGITPVSEQDFAMMNASQLGPVLNSRDESLVLTPELCEQGITRVKAYLAEIAARAARKAANTEALSKRLIAAGLWSIDNVPGCLRHNVMSVVTPIVSNPDPAFTITDAVAHEVITRLRAFICHCGRLAAYGCYNNGCGICCPRLAKRKYCIKHKF